MFGAIHQLRDRFSLERRILFEGFRQVIEAQFVDFALIHQIPMVSKSGHNILFGILQLERQNYIDGLEILMREEIAMMVVGALPRQYQTAGIERHEVVDCGFEMQHVLLSENGILEVRLVSNDVGFSDNVEIVIDASDKTHLLVEFQVSGTFFFLPVLS